MQSKTPGVCMTDMYEKSDSYKQETERIIKKNGRFVPLIMQKRYKPTEWLASLIGSKNYFDFTRHEFH